MAKKNCPECDGTGWRVVEAAPPAEGRMAVPCTCTETDRQTHAWQRARIPSRYKHCDFENFEVDYCCEGSQAVQWNQSLKSARTLVEKFVSEYPIGTEHGLLLMGPCGVGKTHLAVAALRALLARGHHGLFFDYRDLLKQIQASYNPESQTTEMEVLEPVLRCEVLLLDDLGSSKPSAWALETVGHILNARYNDKRVTLVTTNYLDGDSPRPPVSIAGRQPIREDTLADRVGQRIRSRLYEMCRTVMIVAPDFRKDIVRARPGG
ncbi:MAG TPA: ATP-binding protein [Patescibacteria group bacterium]|nr:ATP-binding protein [Patescibacteria group bacterium]